MNLISKNISWHLLQDYNTTLLFNGKTLFPAASLRSWAASFLVVFLASSLAAQQAPLPDTILLKTVEISATPIRLAGTGERREQWSAATLLNHTGHHLGEVLSMESGVFVKNYGPGSSATTSIRGGNAGHTQVIWNGLPVQNPMLGQLDFSLIPTAFVDKVSVAYGGNTASWGSGAIGGTVFLKNNVLEPTRLQASIRSELGSFGWWDQQVRLQFGQKKLRQAIRYFHQEATNDFSYSVSSTLPEVKQSNAAFDQNGLLHELYWQTASNQQLTLHTWVQQTDRQLPPRTTQTRSEARQSDRFLRTAVNWEKSGNKGLLSLKGGLFREEQHYLDPLSSIDTHNDFWKAIAEIDQSLYLSNHQRLQVGLNHTWLQSAAGAYQQSRSQNRSSAFIMYRYNWKNWTAQLNLRQELVDGDLAPTVPGLGIEGQVTDWLALKGKVSRNYRLPTLNDLYWQPGGNQGLKAEHGWSQEVGWELTLPGLLKPEKSGPVTYTLTAFNRHVRDWIQWAVIEGQNFYSPHNITRVWSRGIEQRLETSFLIKNGKIQLEGGYDFIRSTYQQAVERPQFNKGAQLAYTPEHQWFGGLSLNWKQASITYRHQFTGKVSTLNFSELDPYQPGSLYLNYKWHHSSFLTDFFFRMENSWNEDYQVIEYRAMPGRHFRLGLALNFTTNKHLMK